jgi:hypothetical protein
MKMVNVTNLIEIVQVFLALSVAYEMKVLIKKNIPREIYVARKIR